MNQPRLPGVTGTPPATFTATIARQAIAAARASLARHRSSADLRAPERRRRAVDALATTTHRSTTS